MIRLRTLGAVDLKDSEGRELRPLLTQPKRLALLTYLALAGSSGFRRRDTVVALFWPELDEEHARGSLRQALRFLRRSLGEGDIVSRGAEERTLPPDEQNRPVRRLVSPNAHGSRLQQPPLLHS